MAMQGCMGVDLVDDIPRKCWRSSDVLVNLDANSRNYSFCWSHLTVFMMIHGSLYGTFELLKTEEE